MTVNHRWGTETWQHTLTCKHPDMTRVRTAALATMRAALIDFKTYSPLLYFTIDFFTTLDFSQPCEPVIAHALSNHLFRSAYNEQSQSGWDHFARGLLSVRWNHLQQIHLQRIETKDMHALDKWARAFTKSILEYNRTMSNERCRILKKANDQTYEQRQHKQDWQLCLHLRKLEYKDHHHLYKPESFFLQSTMDTLHQWREKICMSIEPAPIKSNEEIRSFFPLQNDTPTLNPSRKRKHTSITTSKQSQSQLFRYQFTRSIAETAPPDGPPLNEYVLPFETQ